MLTIGRIDVQCIVEDAQSRLPSESCGLIAGDLTEGGAVVRHAYPLDNMDDSPTHFSLDPADQFDVMADIHRQGFTLLGNFHSHTRSAPFPSPEDIRLAYDKDAYYLIVSLEFDEPILRAFRHEDDVLVEVQLRIID